jgi:cyclic di-GMP phosphodiesterase
VFADADVLDALTTERPYRPASSFADAQRMIEAESGTHFDPRAVEAFGEIDDETFERIRGQIGH